MMATAVLGGAICLFVSASGCGLQPTGDQLQAILGQVFGEDALPDPNATVIRIINQSGADLQLTLDIDGQIVTYDCPEITPICDFRQAQCPQRIRAIAERRFDSGTGAFVGGRDFIGSDPQFNLERPSDFDCGNVIIFRFFGGEIEVLVL
jgi:hypothetical protein